MSIREHSMEQEYSKIIQAGTGLFSQLCEDNHSQVDKEGSCYFDQNQGEMFNLGEQDEILPGILSFGQEYSDQPQIMHSNEILGQSQIKTTQLKEDLGEESNVQNYESSQDRSRITKKLMKHILEPKKRDVQEKNTPRFLVRLLITHLKLYYQFYTNQDRQKLHQECERLENQVRQNKRAVYLVSDLKKFLNDPQNFSEDICSLNRRFYCEILQKFTIKEMLRPKSQIRSNRIRYLRTAKVFSLRCRSQHLVDRNQSQ